MSALISDKGAIMLAAAVVSLAISDYKGALLRADEKDYKVKAVTLEHWFLSEWGQLLTFDNGGEIIRKCKKEVEKANDTGTKRVRYRRTTEEKKIRIGTKTYYARINGVIYAFRSKVERAASGGEPVSSQTAYIKGFVPPLKTLEILIKNNAAGGSENGHKNNN